MFTEVDEFRRMIQILTDLHLYPGHTPVIENSGYSWLCPQILERSLVAVVARLPEHAILPV